jgi:glutathione S-transferase
VLKIWGRTNSVNVQKVMWAVGELGVKHERIDAGLAFGLVNEPWYRAMNPNGRIPLIEDDGLILWESNAIVRFLSSKYGEGSLYPTKLEARADTDRWMEWSTSTISPVMSPLFWGLIRTPPEQRNIQLIDESRDKMEEYAAILDAHLVDKCFITGDTLTMGDIPLGCFINRWYRLPIERPSYANLAAWIERLRERPAFRQHVMLPLT